MSRSEYYTFVQVLTIDIFKFDVLYLWLVVIQLIHEYHS